MSKVEIDCGKWLQEAEEFALPNWSALPSIPLYMDQLRKMLLAVLFVHGMIHNAAFHVIIDHTVRQ